MGKSATAGAPFGDITSLRRGDVISVTTGQGHFRFVVEDQRVGGDPLPEIPPSGALLTLVTATGSSWLGDVAPSHLVYVDAVLVGHDVAAPPGRPHSISSSEIQGRSDPAAWPWVIVWFVGLVAGYLGTVFLWARWRLWRTWLVAAPVLTGLLWGLSNEVLRLVPNVY
jgi:hypothetical protein